MPRVQLHPHPTTPPAAAHDLSVAIDWHAAFTLHYQLRADIDALRIPALGAPQRTDELWRHTCCEVFLALPGTTGYCEFNFSPGGPWAAYGFDDYRSGMRALEIEAPRITTHLCATQLDVHVQLSALPWLTAVDELHCAVTAVLETLSGTRSFWALRHPATQPDFHHRDGFALRLSRS